MVEKKARQLTFRGMQRRIKRDEQREEKRTLGRWWGFDVSASDAIGPSDLSVDLTLPTPDDPGILIYGMDALLAIRYTGTSKTYKALVGSLMVCHIRPGQTKSDFLAANNGLPSGSQWEGLARPRSYINFFIEDVDSDRHAAVIPFSFFRGHQIRLLKGEFISFIWAFPIASAGNVEASISGRYRYIKKP